MVLDVAANDVGLAFTMGLTSLPKPRTLGSYSWRARRESGQKLLAGTVRALRPGHGDRQGGRPAS